MVVEKSGKMSETMSILSVAIDTPVPYAFDYLPPEGINGQNLYVGQRVRVPFRRGEATGIIVALKQNSQLPSHMLKRALALIDQEPLWPQSSLELLQWAVDYYHHPIGEVYMGVLPKFLRQGKPAELKESNAPATIAASQPLSLNTEQQQAVASIAGNLGKFQGYLLEGITGSGKTEVYLHAIADVLARGQQALVLVPEIGLTPQAVERFTERFAGCTVALHSGLNDTERMQGWLQARTGIADIVIGTRSAVFTPMANLGIIIVDEEHDLSFKQQDGFRYSARDLALVRGRQQSCPVVLGSATPAFETLLNAQHGRYTHLQLSERATGASLPSYRVLDLRQQKLQQGIAPSLLTAMTEHLQHGNQVLLFLNRRGFAPTLLCHDCGWVANCHRCDARLTLHLQPPTLHCHHCMSSQRLPHQCTECQSEQLLQIGMGTERVEQVLQDYFTDYPILRIDRDSTRRKGAMAKLIKQINKGDSQILLGTQMLAKGHHFPNVTLVAILDIAYGLFSADFRASERLGQLLIQVAGRAGRADKPGEVIIQTHQPDHPLLQTLLQQGYNAFAKLALAERQQAGLPPYSHMALFRAEAVKEQDPMAFLQQLRTIAEQVNPGQVASLGPIPAPMARRAGRYRAQLLLQASQRQPLHNVLAPLMTQLKDKPISRKVRWSLDVDPLEVF